MALNTNKSPNTINRMIAAVKRVVKEAAKKEMITQEINLKFKVIEGVKENALKTRLKQNARTRISPDDMRRLCQSPKPDTLIGMRDRSLLATLASSAGRASEIATLTQNQIIQNGTGYMILICGKTDIKPRDACLSTEAYDLIQKWISVRPVESQYIFTSFTGRGEHLTANCMSETSLWRTVQKYAQKCGLSNLKPHDFRRFVGTQLAKDDIRKAQKALGHKSIETTARHYVLDTLEPGLTDHLY